MCILYREIWAKAVTYSVCCGYLYMLVVAINFSTTTTTATTTTTTATRLGQHVTYLAKYDKTFNFMSLQLFLFAQRFT